MGCGSEARHILAAELHRMSTTAVGMLVLVVGMVGMQVVELLRIEARSPESYHRHMRQRGRRWGTRSEVQKQV